VKKEVERSDTGEFNIGGGVTCEADQMEDCSIKQEKNYNKIYLLI